MKQAYERHELEAHRINTVKTLRPHLCDAARGHGKPKPDECLVCETGCAYGDRLLELMGFQVPKHKTSASQELMRQGEALPTLRQRMKKRNG